jgi:hypothetical protein
MTQFSGTLARKPRNDANGELLPLDKLGREITVGSYIAYGHALGRCAGMRIGKVLRILQEKKHSYGRNELIFKIKVWGIDDDWTHIPVLCNTPGTLNFPERMLVVSTEDIPPDFAELLKDITVDSKVKDVRATIPSWDQRIERK